MALVSTLTMSLACSAVRANDALVIDQKARAFHPGAVIINRGDTLTFRNRDEFLHQVYVKSDQMSFDSAEQSPGQSVQVSFPASGTFEVRCQIHPTMLLTVHVK
jgi:plastocyanin